MKIPIDPAILNKKMALILLAVGAVGVGIGEFNNIRRFFAIRKYDDVRSALKRSSQRYPVLKPYLTAYQILEELPSALSRSLIRQRGRGGKLNGTYYSAASVVAKAAKLAGADIEFLNTTGLELHCARERIEAGNPNVGLYRLR
ncbi:MAG TPA: hypothetical protein VN915_16860 [Elusimicrobiota bacterium]|nr:hypothetical protein [Elusimicrobiota bacterium]